MVQKITEKITETLKNPGLETVRLNMTGLSTGFRFLLATLSIAENDLKRRCINRLKQIKEIKNICLPFQCRYS